MRHLVTRWLWRRQQPAQAPDLDLVRAAAEVFVEAVAAKPEPAPPAKPPLDCSFCAKTLDEVRKLIVGLKATICDECVELCVDIIREDSVPVFRDGWMEACA